MTSKPQLRKLKAFENRIKLVEIKRFFRCLATATPEEIVTVCDLMGMEKSLEKIPAEGREKLIALLLALQERWQAKRAVKADQSD